MHHLVVRSVERQENGKKVAWYNSQNPFFAREVEYKSLALLPKRGLLEFYEATFLSFSSRSVSPMTT